MPKVYDGFGLNLTAIAAEQTTLASTSPATALAINMHHVIVGMARFMMTHDNLR